MELSYGFSEMSEEEMEAVDGGLDVLDTFGNIVCGGAGVYVGRKVGATVGGAVGGPVGAVVGGILGVAVFEIVYHLNN